MKHTRVKHWLSLLLCIVLTAVLALTAAGCSGSGNSAAPTGETATVAVLPVEDGAVLGEGETEFSFTIADRDGKETHVEIHTDRATVGEALQELGLIEGEDSQYGLYVKTVNGITADYDKDGVYWAFYVNGEYATSGVGSTEVAAGAEYAFRIE